MSIEDPEGKKLVSMMTRAGESMAFAGFTRVVLIAGGATIAGVLAWAGHDILAVMSDIRDSQQAIIAVSDKEIRIEGRVDNLERNTDKFNSWAQAQVQEIAAQGNAQNRILNEIQGAEQRTATRVGCLEHKVVCPP